MDTRRSYYLASRQDDVDLLAPDEAGANFTAIPYVTPANDNIPSKDRLSTRVGALLRRLIALHGLIGRFRTP
jgi:hypothetical protein